MPNYSDLDGTVGERFYILNAAATEGDIAVFDALQGIGPVAPLTVFTPFLLSFTDLITSLQDEIAVLTTNLNDLTTRVEALENP